MTQTVNAVEIRTVMETANTYKIQLKDTVLTAVNVGKANGKRLENFHSGETHHYSLRHYEPKEAKVFDGSFFTIRRLGYGINHL